MAKAPTLMKCVRPSPPTPRTRRARQCCAMRCAGLKLSWQAQQPTRAFGRGAARAAAGAGTAARPTGLVQGRTAQGPPGPPLRLWSPPEASPPEAPWAPLRWRTRWRTWSTSRPRSRTSHRRHRRPPPPSPLTRPCLRGGSRGGRDVGVRHARPTADVCWSAQVYNKFLDIMKAFKNKTIDTPGVIRSVSQVSSRPRP
jgi:hypothetical protein